jgi:hypothetical protein
LQVGLAVEPEHTNAPELVDDVVLVPPVPPPELVDDVDDVVLVPPVPPPELVDDEQPNWVSVGAAIIATAKTKTECLMFKLSRLATASGIPRMGVA